MIFGRNFEILALVKGRHSSVNLVPLPLYVNHNNYFFQLTIELIELAAVV